MNKLHSILFVFTLFFNGAAFAAQPSNSEIKCLADTIYHEARGESDRGKKAVALVTLNRTKHGGFRSSVCGVVHQRGQYSWVGKGKKVKERGTYNRIHRLASQMYSNFHRGVIPPELSSIKGAIYFSVGGFRGRSFAYAGKIGSHRFYRGR